MILIIDFFGLPKIKTFIKKKKTSLYYSFRQDKYAETSFERRINWNMKHVFVIDILRNLEEGWLKAISTSCKNRQSATMVFNYEKCKWCILGKLKDSMITTKTKFARPIRFRINLRLFEKNCSTQSATYKVSQKQCFLN